MIISVIGSGGKTSYIKELKDQYIKENKTVLITTTTHMKIEEDTLVDADYERIMSKISEKGFCHAGSMADEDKICALDNNLFNRLKKSVDVILIEADGSKQLPLKFPNENEPVVDFDTDEIVFITNLKGLNCKVKDVVHRYELMNWDLERIVDAKMIQDLVSVYLKKCPNMKIRVNGADTLYKRSLKTLIEEKKDVNLIRPEWFGAQPKLVLLGAGHVSQYVAKMAHILDFYTIVVDSREEFANRACFPTANEVHCVDFNDMESVLPDDNNACYVIVTRGHKDDRLCLEKCIHRSHLYLGMIGSKSKVYKTFHDLVDAGYSKEELDKVYAPIGLDILAQTPAEIAISILGQIIQIKNARYTASITDELRTTKDHGVLCIITSKHGSSPRSVGSMMLVKKDEVIDTIGGGRVEYQAILDARDTSEVCVRHYELNNSQGATLGMICGGSNDVLFIPV